MTPYKHLTPEDAHRLLVAAGVQRAPGELWDIADVTRWMIAAGERKNGLLVVSLEKFNEAFPEVRKALDAEEAEEPARKLPELKPAYTPAELAALMGWSTKRMFRWLRAKGVLESHGPRKHLTTPEKLASTFPEAYGRLVADITERADSPEI